MTQLLSLVAGYFVFDAVFGAPPPPPEPPKQTATPTNSTSNSSGGTTAQDLAKAAMLLVNGLYETFREK